MLNDIKSYSIKKRLREISNVILIGSGKGGVGKSTIAVSLSLALKEKGYKVGLLDADIHGPTDSILLSIKGDIRGDKNGITPYVKDDIKVMSIGAFNEDLPLVAHGKNEIELIKDLLAYVNWGELDYLVIDLPPGIGDEVIASIRYVREKATSIIVTTPGISTRIVNRFINFLNGEKIPIKLVIVNMAYIECEGKKISLFGNNDVKFNYPILEVPMIISNNKIEIIKDILLKSNSLNL
ncbi:MAG: P-loop NTPase [Candidatus Rehaiarchaeum fermentans]|nr:P-loop NTPase [Candidatus Rehaiarchaeum fermentans]